jgi:hypothetical protein
VAAGASEILKKICQLGLRSASGRATLRAMNVILKYRGREVTDAEAAFIRDLIAAHPGVSRRRLSQELCRAWNWVQPNGHPREMVCRGLMLALHRCGQIVLPPPTCRPLNPLAKRSRPAAVEVDRRPLQGSLQSLGPLRVEQVRRTPQEGLFNSLIEQHHYLGYTQPVGEQLKYLVFAGERLVACLAWSSAPRHLGPRDRFLGWSAEVRRKNLHLIASNLRFLVLPWVQVPHLASHLLGRMARQLSGDWERVYGHGLYFVETFVDSERFRGTCYRAANWIVLGRTTGRGKDDQTHRANRSRKEIWGYPLHRHFRRRLCEV